MARGLPPGPIPTSELHGEPLAEFGILAEYRPTTGAGGPTTTNAARALGIEDQAGSLAEGREADISVIEVVEGRWKLTDATGESRTASQALVPFLTIKGGEIVEGAEAPHPWGWGPPTAVEAEAVAGDGDSG